MESIPIISQALSLVDYVKGHSNSALERHHQFTTKAIFISQIKSLLLYFQGRKLESQLTQIQFLSYPNSLIQLAYLLGLAVGPMITMAMIDDLGFTSIGIRSHSWAAYWQHSSQSDGWFRSLQHVGSKGLPFLWSFISAVLFAMIFSLFIVVVLRLQQVEEGFTGEEGPLLTQIEVEEVDEETPLIAPASPISVD